MLMVSVETIIDAIDAIDIWCQKEQNKRCLHALPSRWLLYEDKPFMHPSDGTDDMKYG